MNSLLHNNKVPSNSLMRFAYATPSVQRKLTIDIYEREADAMADMVMSMSANETSYQPKAVTGLIGRSLQRKCTQCEEDEKKKTVIRKAENGTNAIPVSSSFSKSLKASKGGGLPLPQGTKSFMENAFSTDFS